MSAIEHLLTTHLAADQLRAIALADGVKLPSNGDLDPHYRSKALAAEYVKSVGVERAWNQASQHLQWGRRAIHDFPLVNEVTIKDLRGRLADLIGDRGDVFSIQATRELVAYPQVAFVRQLDKGSILLVVDQGIPLPLPQLEVGMRVELVPTWTLAVLSPRGSSSRLEVYADAGRAFAVAGALCGQMGLELVLPEPFNVELRLPQIDGLADQLGASITKRSVRTHQDQTGLRKLQAEAGGSVFDIREAAFYDQMRKVTDEGDRDTMVVPWENDDYTLQVSTRGSFWFRSFAPRNLVEYVLGRAEAIIGI